MEKKVLITGGAGYIGSVLVNTLLQENYRVSVIDNFMYMQPSLLDSCGKESFSIIRGDARDESLLKKEMRDADVIIPLACLTGAPLCAKNPWEARSVIVDAVKSIIKLKSSEQILIYPNTNSGYGIGKKGTFCTEESPLTPISLYGQLKVEAEKLITDTKTRVVYRLATVFGASQRMRVDLLVNDFVYRAVTDKFVVLFEADAKRNYVHVQDVVRAFIFAMENISSMNGNVYNLGLSEANISKRELCERIKKHVPGFYFTVAEIGEDPDKRDYIVSNEKIEKTGFVFEHGLDRGIIELLKVFEILHLKNEQNLNFQ